MAGVSVCFEVDPAEWNDGLEAQSEGKRKVKDDLKVFGLNN